MVSTFTPNVQIEQPARGDDVGTWDTPVNNNMSLIDLIVGGITTIGLNNTNVVLSAAQFKARHITFNSTLTGSVTITFPSSFTKSYEIEHLCTGSSAFTITLQTTVTGGQVICASPGECLEVWNDGTNLKYKNLGRIGHYWDHSGSSVPAWISGCTVPPYLNCDGTTFSSGTYPQLATILGGTTLPDSRGRYRAFLNQTTGRMTSAGGGIDGNTVFASGGIQNITVGTSNLPANIPYKDAGHTHNLSGLVMNGLSFIYSAGGSQGGQGVGGTALISTGINITINPSTASAGTGNAFQSLPPSYVGGISMIRAA